MANRQRILVVDDEMRYLRAIRANLETSGYRVVTAQNGRTAIELVAGEQPDLMILDLRLPDLDGLQVCRRVREFSSVPIIMLTALAEDADKVNGLDAGADDYVTKPFSAQELLARVRAALRRAELASSADPDLCFDCGALRVDLASQRVFVDDQEVQLSATEYKLLRELVREAGRVLTPGYLLETAWGPGYEQDDHLVWQAVHRLRKKIEPDPQKPRYIHTRPGIGYVFEVV